MAVIKKPNYTYIGEVNSQGQPHGNGKVEFIDGSRYTGQFKLGKRDGEGVYYYPVTSKCQSYEGSYANDKPEGYGAISYRNGDRFEGSFKDGKKHGWGTYYRLLPGGRRESFYGQYHFGLKFGQFVKRDKFGKETRYFENEWKSEEPVKVNQPQSAALTPDKVLVSQSMLDERAKKRNPVDRIAMGIAANDSYTGEKSATGKPHGRGTYVYHNGAYRETYEGELSFGRLTGKGRYTYRDGSFYEGGFQRGKEHGEGCYSSGKMTGKYNVGIAVYGTWQYGVLLEGEVHYKLRGEDEINESYVGKFAKGSYIPHGQGVRAYKDGSWYKGEFYMGKRQGFGEYRDGKNGSVYLGEWHNDMRHGKGSLTYSYESEYYGYKNKYGTWENDVFKG